MQLFKFKQPVLDKNRKLLSDSKYASSCPLFFRRTIVGQLETETKVSEFSINGVKKFRVQTDFTFDLCNAADPEVLTGRFIRTADTLDLRFPLAACAAVSTKPRSNPRLTITAQGAKRTVSVSTDLPAPSISWLIICPFSKLMLVTSLCMKQLISSPTAILRRTPF